MKCFIWKQKVWDVKCKIRRVQYEVGSIHCDVWNSSKSKVLVYYNTTPESSSLRCLQDILLLFTFTPRLLQSTRRIGNQKPFFNILAAHLTYRPRRKIWPPASLENILSTKYDVFILKFEVWSLKNEMPPPSFISI